ADHVEVAGEEADLRVEVLERRVPHRAVERRVAGRADAVVVEDHEPAPSRSEAQERAEAAALERGGRDRATAASGDLGWGRAGHPLRERPAPPTAAAGGREDARAAGAPRARSARTAASRP